MGSLQIAGKPWDFVRLVPENLATETRERAPGDDKSASLLVAVRQAVEKEIKDMRVLSWRWRI